MVCTPTTIAAEKQCILRTLMVVCVVLALGAAVVGSASYPSLASSWAALVNPTTTPLEGASSYPLVDDADDADDGVDDQRAVAWGLILLMGALPGWRLCPLYRQAKKLHSIFDSPLERPG
jgi:hypothetical protein